MVAILGHEPNSLVVGVAVVGYGYWGEPGKKFRKHRRSTGHFGQRLTLMNQGALCSRVRAAVPISQANRHPRLHFRGLLRLRSRYGPLDCSAAYGSLVARVAGYPAKPLASYQLKPTTIWWNPPPLVV